MSAVPKKEKKEGKRLVICVFWMLPAADFPCLVLNCVCAEVDILIEELSVASSCQSYPMTTGHLMTGERIFKKQQERWRRPWARFT